MAGLLPPALASLAAEVPAAAEALQAAFEELSVERCGPSAARVTLAPNSSRTQKP
jgi:hypothetical protein